MAKGTPANKPKPKPKVKPKVKPKRIPSAKIKGLYDQFSKGLSALAAAHRGADAAPPVTQDSIAYLSAQVKAENQQVQHSDASESDKRRVDWLATSITDALDDPDFSNDDDWFDQLKSLFMALAQALSEMLGAVVGACKYKKSDGSDGCIQTTQEECEGFGEFFPDISCDD